MAETILPAAIELNGTANGNGRAAYSTAELQEQFEALGRELLQKDPVALMVSTNSLRRQAQLVSPPGQGANHPLIAMAGVHKDDPTFATLMERIQENRAAMDSTSTDEENT